MQRRLGRMTRATDCGPAVTGRCSPRVKGRRFGIAAKLSSIVGCALLIRLGLGMLQPPEADEATLGIAALRLLHGHPLLMESNAHYLGALGVYITAPFIAVFGPGTLALRLAMSIVGAGFVLVMYGVGRQLWGTQADGLRTAGISAVFPLFAVVFTVHSQLPYGEILLLEGLCILLTIRCGWGEGRRAADWLLLGLVLGVALWTTPLLAVAIAPCAAVLLLRGSLMGWRASIRRGAAAVGGALMGFSPWLIYNLTHHAPSLGAIPSQRIGTRRAASEIVGNALPIFMGSQRSCGSPATIPAIATSTLVIALLAGAAFSRRRVLAEFVRGRMNALQPADLVLAIAPVSVLAVTVGSFNSLSCQPRYLLPLTVPLVTAASLALRRWRLTGALALALWFAVESVTMARTPAVANSTTMGSEVPANVASLSGPLEMLHLEAIYADYWLQRPLLYSSGGRLVMGEYSGYIGFPSIQRRADASPHPSWLFIRGAPEIRRFEEECRRRQVVCRGTELQGLTLFANLTYPIRPADLGFSVDPAGTKAAAISEDAGSR